MDDIEDLKQQVAGLQKAVIAIALGQPTAMNEHGYIVPADEGQLACSIEGRNPNAVVAGTEAWCRVHGFNCPNFGAKK